MALQKHKVGLLIRYTVDALLPSHLDTAADFEVDLCCKVAEAGMEQYRVMHPDAGKERASGRLRCEFLIVAGVEATTRQEAEAQALKLLLQVEQGKPPEGIEAVRASLSSAIFD